MCPLEPTKTPCLNLRKWTSSMTWSICFIAPWGPWGVGMGLGVSHEGDPKISGRWGNSWSIMGWWGGYSRMAGSAASLLVVPTRTNYHQVIIQVCQKSILVGGLEHVLKFPQYLGWWSNLTFIFFRGVAQPPTSIYIPSPIAEVKEPPHSAATFTTPSCLSIGLA